ncbi:hypothetical protein AGMMS49965_16280 [Bacteroidia bacterium]|nr:hypothetical protein AGMMS49965_16280 [Bacteroidia bacterium]
MQLLSKAFLGNVKNSYPSPLKSLPFALVGAFFIALSLFLTFAPGITRGWGLNYIAFFDPWVIGLFYLLLLCFWLPQTNQYLVAQITAISRHSIISVLQKHRYLFFIIISLCAVGVFHLLKIKYTFLGDNDFRATQIAQGTTVKQEYLTMVLGNYSYAWLHAHFDFTAYQTVRLIDDIAGCLFIFFSLCTANLLGNTFLKKAAAFIISTLSLAILMQFCGYLEIYALPVLFLRLYLFTSLLYLKNKTYIIVPTLVLLLGIGLHLMLVCMLPSLIFLFYGKVLWKEPFFRRKTTLVVLALSSIFLLSAVAWMVFPIAESLQAIHPLKDDIYMTLFSIAHCKEFLNSQLLGGGIGLFIWLMLLVYSIVFKIKYNLTAWFFQIASASFIGLLFVFNPDRGSADWDILAFASVVYNLSNACFLVMLYDNKLVKNIKYGVLMIAGFSILHTSMWLFTNKTDASIKWVQHAFRTDPASIYIRTSFNNESMLSIIFRRNDLKELALVWAEKAYLKHSDDPRLQYEYALALLGVNKNQEAYAILEQTVKDFPWYVYPYPYLVNYYAETNNTNAFYKILVQMEQAYEQYPEAFTSQHSQQELDWCWAMLAEMRKNSASQPL